MSAFLFWVLKVPNNGQEYINRNLWTAMKFGFHHPKIEKNVR